MLKTEDEETVIVGKKPEADVDPADKENCNQNAIPEYLDEDEYDEDDEENDEKLAKWGCSTLEERLEKQRMDEVRSIYDWRFTSY